MPLPDTPLSDLPVIITNRSSFLMDSILSWYVSVFFYSVCLSERLKWQVSNDEPIKLAPQVTPLHPPANTSVRNDVHFQGCRSVAYHEKSAFRALPLSNITPNDEHHLPSMLSVISHHALRINAPEDSMVCIPLSWNKVIAKPPLILWYVLICMLGQ